MRHNALRDSLANMMREGGCSDVRNEPSLLPVNQNTFSSQTNVEDGARLDISARGVRSTFERTFFDVRVSHPHCASNVTMSLPSLYEKNEKEKRLKYEERVRECEKGSFIYTPCFPNYWRNGSGMYFDYQAHCRHDTITEYTISCNFNIFYTYYYLSRPKFSR